MTRWVCFSLQNLGWLTQYAVSFLDLQPSLLSHTTSLRQQKSRLPPEQPPPSAGRGQQSPKSSHKRLVSLAQLKEHRSSMFAGKPSRRERTFTGSQCSVCDEPLEHTLRGERILQLSCGHVAHEACFYEYIKDFEAQACPTCNAPLGLNSSRGGGIDFENLNKLARSAQTPDVRERSRDQPVTPTPWETDTIRTSVQARSRQTQRSTREHMLPEPARGSEHRSDRYNGAHGRNASGDTGMVSTTDYAETQHTSSGRRHDYDVQSMETKLSSPRHTARNPIPAPTVTVRSEFPTLSKSRQQQSLTCLVTVEVVDGKWQPSPSDLPNSPPMAHQLPEGVYEQPKALSIRKPKAQRPVDSVHEDAQHLEEVKDDLYKRVDNWHGLDFARFGRLILYGIVRVGKDRQTWQELECYLFTEMLICMKEKKTATSASVLSERVVGSAQTKPRCTLKGSILIKKHLKHVETVPGGLSHHLHPALPSTNFNGRSPGIDARLVCRRTSALPPPIPGTRPAGDVATRANEHQPRRRAGATACGR